MNRISLLMLIISLLSLSCISDVKADGGCCSRTNIPISTLEEKPLSKGKLTTNLSYEYTDLDQMQEGKDKVESPMDKRTITGVSSLNISYGLTSRCSCSISVPYVHRRHYMLMDGEKVRRRFEEIGDVVLMGKYKLIAPRESTKPSVSLGVGVKTPTGDDDVSDSFGRLDDTLQPGSGTWDPMIGTYYFQECRVGNVFANVLCRLPVDENDHDYQFGNQFFYNAGAICQIHKKFGIVAQLNCISCGHDKHSGSSVVDTGGNWIYFTPGFRITPMENLTFQGLVQLPIYQYVNDVQLTGDYVAVTSLLYNF